MFSPHKHDTGAVLPWEYLPAAAGTYQAGQLMNAKNGSLAAITAASTTTPGYLCMADITVAAGELVPVTRIQHAETYETTLSAAAATATVGSMLEVSAGGTQVDGTAAGSFEVTYIEGTAAGGLVRGRFH